MFKKVFYNTFFQIIGKAFTATTTLLVTILIGRTLGPSGFGEFTKIFVFVGYFYTVCDFGFNSIYVRDARKTSQIAILKNLLALRLTLAFLVVAVAAATARFLPFSSVEATGFSPLVKAAITLALITVITQTLFTTANAYFQKNLRYDLSTIAVVLQALVILALSTVVANVDGDLTGYVASYVAGGLILTCVAYFLITKSTGQFPLPVIDLAKFRWFIASSWPIGLALIFNLIYFRLDVLILANTRQSFEVGLYGLAYQFFEASLTIPIFLANAIYPTLTLSFRRSLARYHQEVKKWLLVSFLVSLVVVVFLLLVSQAIPYLYGQDFTSAVLPLRILASGLPFFFISALLWYLVILTGRQKYLAIAYGLGALFNLAANLILIPIYGFLAAAVVTVVSEGLILLLLIVILRLPTSLRTSAALR